MTKRIIYFTAGPTATAGELADVAKLNAAAEAPYEVLVVNGSESSIYGENNRIIPGDFVSGTVPANYHVDSDPEESTIYPEIDPDNLPVPDLEPTQAIVSDEDVLELLGEDVTASVADNVLSLSVAGTLAFVKDGDTLPVTTGGDPAGTVTFAVVDGVLTGTFVAA